MVEMILEKLKDLEVYLAPHPVAGK
jgi:hypothetical protein